MDTKKVTKVPAAMEDLACGVGTQQQQRAGQDVEVTMIDMHLQVSSEEDIRKIDITKYHYAKIGEVAYRFDVNAVSGIPSDFGPGFWNKEHLPASAVETSRDETVENELTTLLNKVAFNSDIVGTNKKLFSAKVKKTATGWELEDNNKVLNVATSIKPGAFNETFQLTLENNVLDVIAISSKDFMFDFDISDKSLDLCLLHSLSGTVDVSTGGLNLFQDDVWSSVTVDLDAVTGEITINHPNYSYTVGSKKNPYAKPGTICNADSTNNDKQVAVSYLVDGDTTHKIVPMAPLHAYVKYNVSTDDFTVTSNNVSMSAVKGSVAGSVRVDHPYADVTPFSMSEDSKYISHSRPSGSEVTTIELYNYSGSIKSTYDVDTRFFISSPSLVPTKWVDKARVHFDLGPVVVPPKEFNVGFYFYIIGLVEA